MQITLNQNEIEKAIIAYIGNQGIVITGNTTVTLVAGRAPNGMSATIDISNEPPVLGTMVKTTAAGPTVVEVADDSPGGPNFNAAAEEPPPFKADADKPLFGKD